MHVFVSKSLLLPCMPSHLSFSPLYQKKILKKVLHLKYFIYLRNQIPILLKQS